MRLSLVLLLFVMGVLPVSSQSAYAPAACAYESAVYEIECGTLSVPQSRTSASGTIQLAVVIIRTNAVTPAPDPVVYLAGGPGGGSTAYTTALAQTWLQPFLQQRDVILVDQRGAGRSVPSLACDEFSRALIEDLSTAAFSIDAQTSALDACYARLTRMGVVTSAYTSAESAADLEDLRVALGLETWNVFGVSYGTRLALTVLRDYPQGVRRVILDSVYPPQVNLYTELYDNSERARQALFAACAADAACAKAYPDLEGRFWRLVEQLNDAPQTVQIRGTSGTRNFVWSGNRLYGLVFLWMYDRRDLAFIPYYVDRLWHGHYDDLGLLRAALDAELSGLGLSMGLYMSVQCGEERPSSLTRDRLRLLNAYPRLNSLLRHDLWLSETGDTTCRQWQPQPPVPRENAPVTSAVPALLLSGQYDPITPPAWADVAAQTLSDGQRLNVPEVGHGVIRSSVCAARIAAAFLDDNHDTTCLANVPPLRFFTPLWDTTPTGA